MYSIDTNLNIRKTIDKEIHTKLSDDMYIRTNYTTIVNYRVRYRCLFENTNIWYRFI